MRRDSAFVQGPEDVTRSNPSDYHPNRILFLFFFLVKRVEFYTHCVDNDTSLFLAYTPRLRLKFDAWLKRQIRVMLHVGVSSIWMFRSVRAVVFILRFPVWIFFLFCGIKLWSRKSNCERVALPSLIIIKPER